jgi:hypothetical protein
MYMCGTPIGARAEHGPDGERRTFCAPFAVRFQY